MVISQKLQQIQSQNLDFLKVLSISSKQRCFLCALPMWVHSKGPSPLQILMPLPSTCRVQRVKESCFPDFLKVSSVVPVFKNNEERSMAKNYHTVSLLSVISKIFENL